MAINNNYGTISQLQTIIPETFKMIESATGLSFNQITRACDNNVTKFQELCKASGIKRCAPNEAFVVIRSANSGVHFGILESQQGDQVYLREARRIWSWAGAFSLSTIALNGVDARQSKIDRPVPEMTVLGVCEIIPANFLAIGSLMCECPIVQI